MGRIHKGIQSIYKLFIEATSGSPNARTELVSLATEPRVLELPDASGRLLLDAVLDEQILPQNPLTNWAPLYTLPVSIAGDDPETILTVPPGYAFLFQDLHGWSRGAYAGATVQAFRDAAPITDAISCEVEDAVFRAGTIEGNEQGLTPGQSLIIQATNNPVLDVIVSGYFRKI